MKYCLMLIIVLVGQFISFQEGSLDGKYAMYFEEKYKSQNCIISFNKGNYNRELFNGSFFLGTVDNQRLRIVLKEENTSFEIIIVKSRIPSDTIPFRTIDTRDKSKPTGDIVIHEGRMIKIK